MAAGPGRALAALQTARHPSGDGRSGPAADSRFQRGDREGSAEARTQLWAGCLFSETVNLVRVRACAAGPLGACRSGPTMATRNILPLENSGYKSPSKHGQGPPAKDKYDLIEEAKQRERLKKAAEKEALRIKEEEEKLAVRAPLPSNAQPNHLCRSRSRSHALHQLLQRIVPRPTCRAIRSGSAHVPSKMRRRLRPKRTRLRTIKRRMITRRRRRRWPRRRRRPRRTRSRRRCWRCTCRCGHGRSTRTRSSNSATRSRRRAGRPQQNEWFRDVGYCVLRAHRQRASHRPVPVHCTRHRTRSGVYTGARAVQL